MKASERFSKSGFRLRDDEFSWQGSLDGDVRFFLRRSKEKQDTVIELVFGQIPDKTVELLIAEFILATGGIRGDRLIFTSIGQRSNSHDATVASFDRIVKIGTNVAVLAGRLVKNSFLDQRGNYWDAVLDIKQKAPTKI